MVLGNEDSEEDGEGEGEDGVGSENRAAVSVKRTLKSTLV